MFGTKLLPNTTDYQAGRSSFLFGTNSAGAATAWQEGVKPPSVLFPPCVSIDPIRLTTTTRRALARLGLGKPGTARFPRPFRPMLAEPAKEPFNDPAWTYEPKWDGIRIIAYVQGNTVRLLSRNLQNYTGLFASVTESLRSAPVPIVLDGEVVALGAEGRPEFAMLQQWLRPGRQPRTGQVSYVVFDCLYVDGHNLKDHPWKERQAVMAALKHAVQSEVVRVSDPFPGDMGTTVYQECQRQGLEGVVAKRLNSKYQAGKRTKDWRKIPFRKREEFVVGGYLSSAPNRLSTLILGQYDRKGKLIYAGLAGSGLPLDTRKVILEELRAAETATCPFTPVPTLRDHWGELRTDLPPHWVTPTLVVEVEYRERLVDGLRHSSLKALRADKGPRQVRLP